LLYLSHFESFPYKGGAILIEPHSVECNCHCMSMPAHPLL